MPVKLNVHLHVEQIQSVLTINSAICSDQSVSRTLRRIRYWVQSEILHSSQVHCDDEYHIPSVQNVFGDENTTFHIILRAFKVISERIRFELYQKLIIIAYRADVKCLNYEKNWNTNLEIPLD